MTNAIEIKGLTKSYGDTEVLHTMDLEVRTGEIIGFLGPNGAGKTTTIRCMLDLIHPNSGTIRILGIDAQRDPVKVRQMTGYLPGELRIEDSSTAEEALKYFAQLRGNSVDWTYTKTLAQRLGLDLRQAMRNFSKGNKQKVGVIQALMSRPKLLLLDEPTSGLDPLIQQEVLTIIKDAANEGTTVFFSSHALSEVQAIAQRLAIIRDGTIVEETSMESLLHQPIRVVEVRFVQPVKAEQFRSIPGVELTSVSDHELHFTVKGGMNALLQALHGHEIKDLESTHPSLEEIFLKFYGSRTEGAK